MAEPTARLVTVLLTLSAPPEADPEDAAQLVADAAASTALQVAHATGVEGYLPVPGATVVRGGRSSTPWLATMVGADRVVLRDLAGAVIHVPRHTVRPDPLDLALLPDGSTYRPRLSRPAGSLCRAHLRGDLELSSFEPPTPLTPAACDGAEHVHAAAGLVTSGRGAAGRAGLPAGARGAADWVRGPACAQPPHQRPPQLASWAAIR